MQNKKRNCCYGMKQILSNINNMTCDEKMIFNIDELTYAWKSLGKYLISA